MKKYCYIAVWTVALVVIAGALLLYEGDLLWKAQQLNLFLCTPLFLKEQLVVPGGLLTWVGTFFTQFFHWPWAGVSLLCGWWLLLMVLIRRAFRVPRLWSGLMLIPVGLLLLTIVDMGYWLYMLKLQGHFFVSTIGTTAVVALLWAYRCVPAKWYLRTVLVFLTCAVGYPLLGIYGLAASLLMAVWSWRLREHALADTIVAVVSVAAVPLLCYRYVYYQTNLANIYYAELPLYFVTEEHHAYYVPYYLLALFFLGLAITPTRLTPGPSLFREGSTKAAHRQTPLPKQGGAGGGSGWSGGSVAWPWIIQAVLLIALVVGVAHFWFKDENFHRELAMQHCVDQRDWTGALQEAARQEDEPTRAVVMLKNLALSRLGRQGSDMYLYKNGSKQYDAPFGMRTMLVVGPLMYYQYGMANYCSRLSTEMGVEFGWRAEYLKLLAKCAILNGEQQHARKYLNILRQTMNCDDWAREAQSLVGDSAAIAADPEMGIVKRMMHYDNRLSTDQGFVERFLMNTLANSQYKGDPLFQEQALLATLWTKNINQFWYRFYDYIRLHPEGPMPRYYQEAAWLYGQLEERPNMDQLPFDDGVKDTFQRFMKAAEPYNNADVEDARIGLTYFNQTYYYDYYLMSRLPEY